MSTRSFLTSKLAARAYLLLGVDGSVMVSSEDVFDARDMLDVVDEALPFEITFDVAVEGFSCAILCRHRDPMAFNQACMRHWDWYVRGPVLLVPTDWQLPEFSRDPLLIDTSILQSLFYFCSDDCEVWSLPTNDQLMTDTEHA